MSWMSTSATQAAEVCGACLLIIISQFGAEVMLKHLVLRPKGMVQRTLGCTAMETMKLVWVYPFLMVRIFG